MNPDFDKLKEAPISGLLGLGGGITARVVPIGGGSEYFYVKTTSAQGEGNGGWRNVDGCLPFGTDGDFYIFYRESTWGKCSIARVDKVGKIQWARRINTSTWSGGTTGNANDHFAGAVVANYNNYAIIRTTENSDSNLSFTAPGWFSHAGIDTNGAVQWGRQRAMPDQSSLSSGNAITKAQLSFWKDNRFRNMHSFSSSNDTVIDVGMHTYSGTWKNPWNGVKTPNTILMNMKASDGTYVGSPVVARQSSDPSNGWNACRGGDVSGSTLYTTWEQGNFVAGRVTLHASDPYISYPRYFKNQYPTSPWNISVEAYDVNASRLLGRYTYPSSSKSSAAILTMNNWGSGTNSSPVRVGADDHVYPMCMKKDGSDYCYMFLWRKSNGNYQMVLQRNYGTGDNVWIRTLTVNDGSEWNITWGGGPLEIKNDKLYFTINKTDKGMFVVLPWDSDGPETGTYGDLTISGAPSGWVQGGGGSGWGNGGTGKDPTGGYRLTHYSLGTNYAPVDNASSNVASGLPDTTTLTLNTETEDIG